MRKSHTIQNIAACALVASSAYGIATAGVIVGTGSAPSATQTGETTATTYRVNHNNLGHILLVPYFTAQNGQMSVIHLVNTDENNGKVVKLRYRGAHNGDSLLSMHVLLSARDVWTGAVVMGASGKAELVTTDRTCTLPAMKPGVAQPFLTSRLDPALSATQLANQTREGTVEAIVMANVPTRQVYGAATSTPLRDAISQVNGIAPCTSSVLDSTFMDDISDEATAASRGLAGPTSGVAATWYIMDVPGATTFSGAATAIEAVDPFNRPARANIALFPPSGLAITQPERFTTDPLLVPAGMAFRNKKADGTTSIPTTAAVVEARGHDLPDITTPYILPASSSNAQRTLGMMSKLMNVRSVSNQFSVEPGIDAQTDFVFSMPTKRFNVAEDYAQSNSALAQVFSIVPPSSDGRHVFASDTLNSSTPPDGMTVTCMVAPLERWADRDTTTTTRPPVFLTPVKNPALCGVVGVMSLKGTTGNSALSASVTREFHNAPFVSGWLVSTFDSAYSQFPIIGAAFSKLSNPNATPGIAGRYGLTYPHLIEQP